MQICEIQSLDNTEKESLQEFQKLIQLTIKEARKRAPYCIEDTYILYSALALNHILESVLDDDFMRIAGGYKMPIDIIEFGKGLA